MVTIRSKMLYMLKSKGFSAAESAEIMALAEATHDRMKPRWDKGIDDYLKSFVAGVWIAVAFCAAEWMNNKAPEHASRTSIESLISDCGDGVVIV